MEGIFGIFLELLKLLVGGVGHLGLPSGLDGVSNINTSRPSTGFPLSTKRRMVGLAVRKDFEMRERKRKKGRGICKGKREIFAHAKNGKK